MLKSEKKSSIEREQKNQCLSVSPEAPSDEAVNTGVDQNVAFSTALPSSMHPRHWTPPRIPAYEKRVQVSEDFSCDNPAEQSCVSTVSSGFEGSESTREKFMTPLLLIPKRKDAARSAGVVSQSNEAFSGLALSAPPKRRRRTADSGGERKATLHRATTGHDDRELSVEGQGSSNSKGMEVVQTPLTGEICVEATAQALTNAETEKLRAGLDDQVVQSQCAEVDMQLPKQSPASLNNAAGAGWSSTGTGWDGGAGDTSDAWAHLAELEKVQEEALTIEKNVTLNEAKVEITNTPISTTKKANVDAAGAEPITSCTASASTESHTEEESDESVSPFSMICAPKEVNLLLRTKLRAQIEEVREILLGELTATIVNTTVDSAYKRINLQKDIEEYTRYIFDSSVSEDFDALQQTQMLLSDVRDDQRELSIADKNESATVARLGERVTDAVQKLSQYYKDQSKEILSNRAADKRMTEEYIFECESDFKLHSLEINSAVLMTKEKTEQLARALTRINNQKQEIQRRKLTATSDIRECLKVCTENRTSLVEEVRQLEETLAKKRRSLEVVEEEIVELKKHFEEKSEMFDNELASIELEQSRGDKRKEELKTKLARLEKHKLRQEEREQQFEKSKTDLVYRVKNCDGVVQEYNTVSEKLASEIPSSLDILIKVLISVLTTRRESLRFYCALANCESDKSSLQDISKIDTAAIEATAITLERLRINELMGVKTKKNLLSETDCTYKEFTKYQEIKYEAIKNHQIGCARTAVEVLAKIEAKIKENLQKCKELDISNKDLAEEIHLTEERLQKLKAPLIDAAKTHCIKYAQLLKDAAERLGIFEFREYSPYENCIKSDQEKENKSELNSSAHEIYPTVNEGSTTTDSPENKLSQAATVATQLEWLESLIKSEGDLTEGQPTKNNNKNGAPEKGSTFLVLAFRKFFTALSDEFSEFYPKLEPKTIHFFTTYFDHDG